MVRKPYSLACVFILFLFVLTGCVDDKNLFNPGLSVGNGVPTELDYSTTRSVEINISYDYAPSGYAATFDLYDGNPCVVTGEGRIVLKEEMEPIASGIAVSGAYKVSKTLPRFVDKLYAYSSHLFAPRLMQANIVDGKAIFEEVDLSTLDTGNGTRAGVDTRTASNGSVDYYLGAYGDYPDLDAGGKPNYIDKNVQLTVDGEYINKIEEAFPNHTPANTQFYQDASLYVQQEAEVWICMLLSDGSFVNELAYFCYDGPKTDLPSLSAAQRADLKLISAFPKAKASIVGVGNYVKLKYYNKATGQLEDKFPAGTTIGWALRPTAWGSYMGKTFYSCEAWNPETTAEQRKHTIYFNAGNEANPFICFGFEDMLNDCSWGWCDGDCNDLMFNVQLNPIDALEKPPVVEIPDADLVTYQTYKGFFGFEDYWPIYFDYDMNDILVKYNSRVTSVKKAGEDETYITELNDEFSIVFTGANFRNMFSYKMDIDPSSIESIYVEGSGPKKTTPRELRDPIDDGDYGFIIDLCTEGARELITAYDYETLPHVYKVTVKFKDKAMKQEDFDAHCAPYNPFMTALDRVNYNGGPEVHLSRMFPTERVNPIFFGAQDDCSRPDEGIYYIGAEDNIYPFSMHVAGVDEFFIPQERQRIDVTYPRFKSWVESGMTADNDWYKYPDTSVRQRYAGQ